MIRPPPRSTLFPTRRSSDLSPPLEIRVLRLQPSTRPTAHVSGADALGDDDFELQPARMTEVIASLSWMRSRIALVRSEEHTSELQSQSNLVCRLLLEKKKHY